MPLPQHVVSCRGWQLEPELSGSGEGLPQDTAPHAPADRRAAPCVKEHRRPAARQAENQSYLIRFPPKSNDTQRF